MSPAFYKLKVLAMMTSLQSNVTTGDQGLLMLMGSKILMMMVKHCSFYPNVLRPSHLFKNFCTIRRTSAPKIGMFCSKVIMTKTFNLSKAGGLGHSFEFHIFSARPLFIVLGSSAFNWGCAGCRLVHSWFSIMYSVWIMQW